MTNPDEIELPLASVVAGLPMDLRAKLMSAPPTGKTVVLQAEMVINQLAFGAVKISFGELRHLVPGIFVNSGGELDNKLVNLPLQEILPRLNPALLARRTARKVEVSDEIVGPFAERGRGFSFTTQPLRGPAVTPPPPPAPAPAPSVPIAFVPPAGIRQVSPATATPPPPQRSITPAAPGGTHGSVLGHALPVSPLAQRTVTPSPGNANGNNGHGHSNGNGHGNGNGMTLPRGLRLGSAPGPQSKIPVAPTPPQASAPIPAMPAPAAMRVEAPQPTIFALLGELCQSWPDELKNEILRSPMAKASVPLEGAIIVPGLKRGRVLMTWKQLRLLAQPSSSPSPHDSLELELPLKVIAPLFLSAQKTPTRMQSKTLVSSEIPDLFFGFPQPAAAPAAAITPVIPPLPSPGSPKPRDTQYFAKPPDSKQDTNYYANPAPKTQDTNYYVWGENGEAPQADEASLRRGGVPQTDFMSRQAHPRDVVARAVTLPGVAGAVVALQDGLRVASQTPAELNADTLAAFLPQIFDRVTQSTRELRMGGLNNLNFTVGNVPWKIFRVNAVYFAAFGRAGEQLPSAQLAQLAAELDRKKL